MRAGWKTLDQTIGQGSLGVAARGPEMAASTRRAVLVYAIAVILGTAIAGGGAVLLDHGDRYYGMSMILVGLAMDVVFALFIVILAYFSERPPVPRSKRQVVVVVQTDR